jgi:hypothetical protein
LSGHVLTCLCFGSLLQMTYNLPFLLTTEHASHSFLTDERTFIPLCCWLIVVAVESWASFVVAAAVIEDLLLGVVLNALFLASDDIGLAKT